MYEVDTTRKERKLFFGFMSLLSFIQSDYSFLNQAPYIFISMAMNLAILGSQPSFAGAKRGVVRARRLGMIVAFNTTDFVMVKVEPF